MSRSGVLQAGEPVLLIDRKKRRYLIDLEEGGEFHSHSGVLPHDELIGKPEGERTGRAGAWCSSPSARRSPTSF